MTLTSTYSTDRILEVSDGHQTMSVAVAHVQQFWTLLQGESKPFNSRVEVFYSQGMGVWSKRFNQRFDRDTRNVIRFDAEGVIWQVFSTLPGGEAMRKEVCWSREELSRVLRAAVVASRLTTHSQRITKVS